MLGKSGVQTSLRLQCGGASLQLAELRSMESQLYDELSKTPKQGGAFADVIKTVLDRETAFLKWKVDGTANFWDKPAAAPAAGPKVSSSCKHSIQHAHALFVSTCMPAARTTHYFIYHCLHRPSCRDCYHGLLTSHGCTH